MTLDVPSSEPAPHRFAANAADFARASLSYVGVVALVRVYELALFRGSSAFPASARVWGQAFAADAAFALTTALVLALPVLVIAHWAPRAARVLHRALLVIIATVAAMLAQYFAATHVALGADLYGYGWQDIRDTVGASQGVSVGALAALVVFAALAWWLPRRALRWPWSPRASVATLMLALATVALPGMRAPAPSAFASESDYLAAANKAYWFASRSATYLRDRWEIQRAARSLSGYPLMHRVAPEDVLGPHFALGAEKPNLVFVIVEGLGRDFTGPGATYGGFTPFLDSLAAHSLSWDNFLSTSGRTFGVLPSLLGSLPFGRAGFMELGATMPAHASLVTYLQGSGYTTNYFTGTNGQFDRIDAFMDRQGVDRFIDAAGFGPRYRRQPAPPGGESWGYPDGALFARSLELLSGAPPTPRLDIYLTISTHEPFIPPDSARYRARFEAALAARQPDARLERLLRENAGVFASLLYTDDALRAFFTAYAKRPDYARTIFFVTGDHRMIPVPATSRLARYRVPFILSSPMLRAPKRIRAISSHFDVLPSVLAMLHGAYGVPVPDRAPWLGVGLDTASAFRGLRSVPLMRIKNELDDYLNGTRLLAGGTLSMLDSTLTPTPVDDGPARDAVAERLVHFRAVNEYVTVRDRITPPTEMAVHAMPELRQVVAEDTAFRALGLTRRSREQAFEQAREMAFAKEYTGARLVLRRLLRDAPSYHDARALLGRTYSWEGRRDEARVILDGLVRRAPAYADGLAARIELDVFAGHGDSALAGADRALASFPGNPSLLYERARALELLGQRDSALRTLDHLRRLAPNDADAAALRARLLRR
ncbi:MAG: sulfatase-like hydrolase/transferase [Gemmatimonadaceae bacterium]|nr:sulfatase-like hydrolase/transferase [Gemmatimonadaceae bacterium]